MKVKIRTPEFRLSLPVPLGLAGFVVRMLPNRLFDELEARTPEPYRSLVGRASIRALLAECLELFRENKGLEVVHVEAADGTFVSIRL